MVDHRKIIARTVAGVLGAIAWAGLAIQFYLTLRAGLSQHQITLSILNYFSYFTILTNLFIASILTISAWPPAPDRETELVGLRIGASAVVYILVVGVIYVLALRRLWNPTGLQWAADMILHYVTPIGYPIFWIAMMQKSFLRWRKIVLWLAYPLAFALITEVRGAWSGWYPYPFLDAASLGYARVIASVAMLTAVFMVLALVVVCVDRVLARRSGVTPSVPAEGNSPGTTTVRAAPPSPRS
ncbi:MAG TPA: Pr6Pr family membrane protein [Tepidisphaeraceae bacterium]|jgi:hypothetical protein|nr:Pr6Pr family membrane protein [Tepidisphaeraceae bacterium]